MSIRVCQPIGWAMGLCLLTAAPAAASADPFANGQRVDVREGDQWSPATITGREGRKYHVHYDGGSDADDEWVTAERLRAVGGSPPAHQPAAPTPTTPTTPAAPATPTLRFVIKDHVEVKWGGIYQAATVLNTRNGWYFIAYDNWSGDSGREWVESDRVRDIGSTDDPIGYAAPHSYKRGDGPPSGPPTVGTAAEQAARRSTLKPTPAKTAPGPTPPVDPEPTPARTHRRPIRDATEGGKPSPAATPDLTRRDSTVGPGGLPLVNPDLSAGTDLEPTDAAPGPVALDPPPVASPPRNVSLNHGPPQVGTETGLLVTPQGRWAAMTFRSEWSSDQVATVQRLELSANDAGRVQNLAVDVFPLALSPDGKRLVTRSDRPRDPASRWRLDVWNVDATEPKPLLSFRPYDPAEHGADGVEWAAYADAAHVLTCSGRHVLTLWAIDDKANAVKEVYTLAGDNTVRPRLSGGGRYVVAGFGGQLVVLDVLSGKCVARGPDPDNGGDGVALRADCKRVALAGGRRLTIVDLDKHEIDTDLGLPSDTLGAELAWVGPNLLLIDDHLVYDVVKRRFVWDYELPAGVRRTFGAAIPRAVGDRVWFLSETTATHRDGAGKSVLTSAPVPDARVTDAERTLLDGTLAVKPGLAVSLEVNVPAGTDDDRLRLTDRFRQQLETNGLTVADGQPVKLAVRTTNGKSETKTYRRSTAFGGFNQPSAGEESVTATATVFDVSFEVDGKPVWQLTSEVGGYLPMWVPLKQGQSIGDAVNERTRPTLAWFFQQKIPREVLASTAPVGASPLTGTAGRTRNTKEPTR